MRKATTAALTAATLLVAGGFYGLADALDIAPGVLTLADPAYDVQPFPSTNAQLAADGPAGLSPDAPVPSSAVLTGYAQTLAADELVGSGVTGVTVIDVATGQTLVDLQGSTPLTPASSNKVITAWAALSAMGAEHRLTTSAVLSGTTVTLVGGGDVLMAADAGDPTAVVGHAGLGDLARKAADKLKEQGVTSVSVTLDDTMFEGPSWSPDWEAGNESWVAPIQPIMIDVTSFGSSTGYPADPAMAAAEAFATALSAAGIEVSGEVVRGAAPQGASALAAVESAPLSEILAVSLKASDNTMTEVEGHVLAAETGYPASFTGAAQAVRAVLEADGFDTTGLTLLDASGLARGNKVPAQLLAQIVARSAGEDGGTTGRTLLTALPVAALDGTLEHRFEATTAAGRVRAKTGSLDQSVSLTGVVVTAEGRLLAYSVIVDGFAEGGLTAARVAIDQDLIGPMAACGCQG